MLDLPITQEQIAQWADGELIQRAMPDLTADQREFLISGVTAEEWKNATQEQLQSLMHLRAKQTLHVYYVVDE